MRITTVDRHHNVTSLITVPIAPSKRRMATGHLVRLTSSDKPGIQPDASTAVVSAIVIAALVLVVAVLLLIRRRRKNKNLSNDDDVEAQRARDSERGSILSLAERRRQSLIKRDVDFTVPYSVSSSPPFSFQRRVLSTPDLGLYDDTRSDISPVHVSSYPLVPSLTKQYSIDFTSSLSRCSLGSLDPELYKATDSDDDLDFPDGHLGRIWFTLEYQKDFERLVVNIVKVKNLPSRTAGSVNCCNPIIRLCLLPDERRHLQSRQKRKTCNPRIDESFCFQISGKCLDERILKVTVYDVDLHKKFKIIGHAVYPLKDLDVSVDDKLFLTRDLARTVTESPSSGNGEVLLSLCYNDNIGRLTVTIFQAKGLPKVADTYAKVSFLQRNKTFKCKKTSVNKKSSIPVFNESFTFKASAMEMASIVVHLMQVTPGHGKDVIIGRVALGSYMFARGRAQEHWNDMLSNCREQLRRWHHLQP